MYDPPAYLWAGTQPQEQFGHVYAKGMTLSFDQALDLALGRISPA
jgi:hypothetical protein